MRVVITGGAGFIGLSLAKRLLLAGHHVVCFDIGEQIVRRTPELEHLKTLGDFEIRTGTILNEFDLTDALRDVDVVYHLAAIIDIARTEKHILNCLNLNAIGTETVLRAARQNRVKHFIFISTSAVYGKPVTNPVDETAATSPCSTYALSKLTAEAFVRGFGAEGLPWTIFRPFNVYGDYRLNELVISRFVRSALTGEPLKIYGDGTQVRCYTHVDDLTCVLTKAALNPEGFEQIVNIGNPGAVHSIREVAQLVLSIFGGPSSSEPELSPDYAGANRSKSIDIPKIYADITLAQKLFGFNPSIDLKTGLNLMKQRSVMS